MLAAAALAVAALPLPLAAQKSAPKPAAKAAPARTVLRAVLLQRQDDPRLQRDRVERAYLGHPGGSLQAGLKVALDEAQIPLEADGVAIDVQVQPVADAAAAKAAAQQAAAAGAAVLLTDLPGGWLPALADGAGPPVLDLTAREDALRQQDCRARLWHVLPSERMRADALAQHLISRRWANVLLLHGPSPADAARLATAQAAAKRFGLKIVATKPFKLSADPRERDLANPLLLTGGGAAYDVVWVIDSDGEFARTLPYRTQLPRPVVGDAGLVPLAWHASFERFGAPQVARRFARAAGRPMTEPDWAGWLAGKILVATATAAPQGPAAAWAAALPAVKIDGSKGALLSFRPWDGQLRQPLLLSDGQGVVAQAPVEGVMHPREVLDTLGADEPEKLCKAPR